jgi:hypothetical protein
MVDLLFPICARHLDPRTVDIAPRAIIGAGPAFRRRIGPEHLGPDRRGS